MTHSRKLQRVQRSTGDLAVDGLLAGLAGGLLMALYLAGVTLVVGGNPGEVFAQIVAERQSILSGLLVHLAVAGVYGVLFGILWKALTALPRPLPLLPLTIGYAILLWLLAETLLLPAVTSSFTAVAPLHFLVAHLIYGLGLGLFIRKAAN